MDSGLQVSKAAAMVGGREEMPAGFSDPTIARLSREVDDLRREKDYYASVIKYFRNGLLTTDNELRVKHFNLTVERVLGYAPAELRGMKLHRLIQSREERVLQILRQGGLCVDPRTGEMGEFSFIAKDGKTFPVEACFSVITLPDGSVNGLTCTFRDVSQKKRMEQAMARMDRLASLGELASGMAHEIKNPLACIAGVLQNFVLSERDDPCVRMIPDLLQQVEKIDAIINGLLNFARPSPAAKEPLLLREVVEETVVLLERRFYEKKITLNCDFGNFASLVSGDRQLLQQAFLNVLKNAGEALERVDERPRRLDIIFSHRLNHDPGSMGVEEKPYEMVEVAIRDNGPGVDRALLETIFNPFFTTRHSGTGLGLATSHRIIEEHDGAITAASTPGQGSVFRISLPLLPN
ncbi:MAG: PAS domain S-box protein [Deltaproteobacteria bacterium]|nr:PAS domain S-box protein [Deltaproteobacteria bacterium]